jgi:hypothetical protein
MFTVNAGLPFPPPLTEPYSTPRPSNVQHPGAHFLPLLPYPKSHPFSILLVTTSTSIPDAEDDEFLEGQITPRLAPLEVQITQNPLT